MSKVLVDRELLERVTNMLDAHNYAKEAEALMAAIAQPAEAEGDRIASGFVILDGMAFSKEEILAQRVDLCNALESLSAVTAERDRLESMLIRTATRHFALQIKDRADDKKLDECLSEGIAMLEAERDRLQQFEAAYNEWHDKTEWVQKTAKAHELGKHRADVLKDRIDQLRAEVEALRNEHTARESMARRLLWLAFVWNDHNFEKAHIEARREAEAHGITTLKQANEWLSRIDAAMAAKEA